MQNRILSFDMIRTIAIMMVVAIHSQSPLNSAFDSEGDLLGPAHWAKAFWHIIYTAVPLFVMLSGALLLGKDESILLFLKKRLYRI